MINILIHSSLFILSHHRLHSVAQLIASDSLLLHVLRWYWGHMHWSSHLLLLHFELLNGMTSFLILSIKLLVCDSNLVCVCLCSDDLLS